MRIRRLLSLGLLLFALVASVHSVERFPPPDFEGGHKQPTATQPPPRPFTFEYMDVAVLAMTLSLASWLVLKKRSRREVVWLSLFSLLYFGFYRKGCICPIGGIQNVTFALADRSYAIPDTVIIFFLLPLVTALFFGRTFCAAVCPHGAIQDLMLLRPVELPTWLDRLLRIFASVYLGLGIMFAALGSAFIICQYDPFVPIFRRTGSLGMLLTGTVFLLVGIFIGRPYCRFVCPYGVLLGLAASVAKWRIRIGPDTCNQCRVCEHSCPVGAINKPSLPELPEPPGTDRRRWAVAVVATLLIMVVTTWLGGRLGAAFSERNATVQLAERIAQEEAGQVKGTTDYSARFRDTGGEISKLYEEARELQVRFNHAGMIFGFWVGLVIGLKLINSARRKRRTDYEIELANCVGCARCFEDCPREGLRRLRLRRAAAGGTSAPAAAQG